MHRRADTGVAAFLILIGLGYTWAASRYSIGEMASPGPGLMPLLLGAVFLILSGYLLLESFRSAPSVEKEGEKEGEGHGSSKAMQVTAALIVYIALMNFLGFALSTFLGVLVFSRLMGLEGWRKPILLGAGTVAAAHLVFVLALDVPLPAGSLWGG